MLIFSKENKKMYEIDSAHISRLAQQANLDDFVLGNPIIISSFSDIWDKIGTIQYIEFLMGGMDPKSPAGKIFID